MVRRRCRRHQCRREPRRAAAGAQGGVRAIAALRRYFKDQLASGKLKGGSDTVLGRLVDNNEDGKLSDDELFFIAMLLLFAGNETTTNLIGGMFDTLAHAPPISSP